MKILICGSRNFSDKALIKGFINSCPDDTIIIEGEARGADSIARDCALERGLIVEKFPANWDRDGKSAGPIRNSQMLKEGNPDIVVAYSDDLKNSKGTRHMISISQRAGKDCYLNLPDLTFVGVLFKIDN